MAEKYQKAMLKGGNPCVMTFCKLKIKDDGHVYYRNLRGLIFHRFLWRHLTSDVASLGEPTIGYVEKGDDDDDELERVYEYPTNVFGESYEFSSASVMGAKLKDALARLLEEKTRNATLMRRLKDLSGEDRLDKRMNQDAENLGKRRTKMATYGEQFNYGGVSAYNVQNRQL